MASVKFYLDKRNKKTDGTYPLKLTVTHQKPFHISLDISIPEENWINGKIEGNIPNKAFLNNYLRAQYSAVENLLLRLKIEEKLHKISPNDLKKMIVSGNFSGTEEKEEGVLGENLLFRHHADKFIETRTAKNTRDTYHYTLNMLSKQYDLNTLTFGNINFEWLENLETTLRKSIAINTISIHLRNIRAIYKNATVKKLVSRDLYPFEGYSIKNEETAHRDLDIADLRTIRDYPVEPHQERYRDFFMLLFYLIGINTVDILHAKTIRNGRLEYRRAKTGKLYSVKLEPEALAIIKKYPGKKHLLNFIDDYANYKDFSHRFNKNLKQIGPHEWKDAKSNNGRKIKKKIYKPLFPFLSSYYSRHSWASIAAGLDIPKETISAALGHGSRSVTDIYINFDARKVDEANRKVIDHLFSK